MNKYLLKDLAKIDISSVDKKMKENEIDIKLCNFTDVYNNWAITKNMCDKFMIATANKNEIERYKLKKGMIAITKDSETREDIGMSAYIADSFEDVILGYHTALIIPDNTKVDSKYLNAYLNSNLARKHFSNSASGSGQRYTLTVDSIGNLPLYLPSLEIQQKIGDLLSCIDKKMESNSQINNNLEELMKTIYQRWFVEYKFPGNTEIIHTKFPEDWNLESIGILFESQSGYAFSSKDWREYGIPVLTIKCINEDGSINYKEASFIQKNEEKLNKYTARNGNIIFAMSGNTIGKTGIVASNYKDLLINQRVLIIKSNSSNLGFIYFTLRNPKIQNIIFKLGANSAQPNISEEQLKAIKVVIPNKKILREYNEACKKYFDIIIENRIENQYLAELKEYLLPLLINGQINVDDIEI